MDPLIAYLRDDCLPEDPKAASTIKRKAPSYWLSKEGNLYKRSFSGPYLLCVHPNQVDNLLFEIHEGICRSHTGVDHWLTKQCRRVIGGHICRAMLFDMSGNVINAKDLLRRFTNLLGSLICYQARGLSLNGAWISWAIFLGRREIKSYLLWQQITSPSG